MRWWRSSRCALPDAEKAGLPARQGAAAFMARAAFSGSRGLGAGRRGPSRRWGRGWRRRQVVLRTAAWPGRPGIAEAGLPGRAGGGGFGNARENPQRAWSLLFCALGMRATSSASIRAAISPAVFSGSGLAHLLGDRPGELGEGPRLAPHLHRVPPSAAVPVDGAFGDALHDRGEAEERRVDDVALPIRSGIDSRPVRSR
jgi:hypothetical protein